MATAPSVSVSVNSSTFNGSYYIGTNHNYYRITVHAHSYDSGVSITQIKLTVGSVNQVSSIGSDASFSVRLTEEGSFTPTVKVTDSQGLTTTKTLSTIRVKTHERPNITYNVLTSPPYYPNTAYAQYSIEITNIEKYDGVIATVTLTVDGSSSSRTSTGVLSGTFTSAGTKTVEIVISDNLGVSRTKTRSVTVSDPGSPPTVSYTQGSTSINYGSSCGVNITGITCESGRTATVTFTVGSQSASKSSTGWIYVTPNSTGSQSASLVVRDSIGLSTSYTLSSVYVYQIVNPSIGTVTTTSEGPYYAGYDTYSVTVASASGGTYSIRSDGLQLKIGSAVATRGNAGDLSVIVPNTTGAITPYIYLYNSGGYSTSKTCENITILANNPPTVDDPVVIRDDGTTSNIYYANHTPYKVQVTNASADEGKIIPENGIVLTVGSQTAAISQDGIITINELEEIATDVTPYVVVFDNKGKSVRKDLPPIIVVPNDVPSYGSYTITTQEPYYKQDSSYGVTFNNITAKNDKTISSIVLQIGNQVVTKTYETPSATVSSETITISSLAEMGTFTPTVTITDNLGTQLTFSLPQIVVTSYVRINSLNGFRIGSEEDEAFSGKRMETGTNLCLVAEFDYLDIPENYLRKPIISWVPVDVTNPIDITWYTSWNRITGEFDGEIDDTTWQNYHPTAPITLYGKITNTLEQSKTYTLSITPRTTHYPNGITPVNYTVAQAFFLLVGRKGGHSLGIGMKPEAIDDEDKVLDINMSTRIHDTLWVEEQTYLDDDVDITGNVDVVGEIVATDDISSESDVLADGYINTQTNYLKKDIPLIEPQILTLIAEDWEDCSQTIEVSHITTNNNIIIAPVLTNLEDYSNANIMCTAQDTNSLTFECLVEPTEDLLVNIIILN